MIGNEKTTITIASMQVVKHCQAPLTGTFFDSESQGTQGTIGIGFNLDSPIDYAQKYDYGYSGDYFKDHVVTLAPGETQTFDIQVGTLLHYCQFTFELAVATPDGTVIENIDDNGKPFELTGTARSPVPARPYDGYAALYVGGIDSLMVLHKPNGVFVQENPKTFHY